MSVTKDIVDFLTSIPNLEISGTARYRATRAIADCVGVTYAGARSPVGQKLGAIFEQSGGEGEFACIGRRPGVSLLDSVLFNAASAHALDYDDTTHPGPLHSSCHLMPTVLGLAPFVNASGSDVLRAYIGGFELEAKLARSLNPAHYVAGWHCTSTVGVFGAAAAAGLLLELSAAQLEMALGIAASEAAGLRSNFGSMTKPLHAGQAARAGVLAALLAREGFDSSRGIFDRRWGYLAVFGVEGAIDHKPLEEFGDPFELDLPDTLGLKPYPCCGEATAVVEAALGMRDRFLSGHFPKLVAYTSTRAKDILAYPAAETVEQARFSLPYCIASSLIWGEATLRTFSDEVLYDRRVRDLMPRIEHQTDRSLSGPHQFGCRIAASDEDGEMIDATVLEAKGWTHRWLDDDELHAKFLDCVGVPADGDVSGLFRRLLALPELGKAAEILDAIKVVNEGRAAL